jgi:hypothetical protein
MNFINKLASASGFHNLIMILPFEFEKAFFWEGLLMSDNATVTARNILVTEQIYRFGFFADILTLIAGTILSLIFYILFKSKKW